MKDGLHVVPGLTRAWGDMLKTATRDSERELAPEAVRRALRADLKRELSVQTVAELHRWSRRDQAGLAGLGDQPNLRARTQTERKIVEYIVAFGADGMPRGECVRRAVVEAVREWADGRLDTLRGHVRAEGGLEAQQIIARIEAAFASADPCDLADACMSGEASEDGPLRPRPDYKAERDLGAAP